VQRKKKPVKKPSAFASNRKQKRCANLKKKPGVRQKKPVV
jgi:hypothetical protein